MTDVYDRFAGVLPAERVWAGEPMSRHTTLRIGGPADVFACARSGEELAAVVRRCREAALSWAVVGNGSNLLVLDGGFRGVVVCASAGDDGVSALEDSSGVGFRAEAGVSLARLAHLAMERGWSGLEFASGIPGTLGGGLRMNAGAYGGELSELVARVRVLDKDGRVETLEPEALEFGYRHSALMERGDIVLGAELRLRRGDPRAIASRMEELAEKRRAKQPLDWPSAGSTWKRPPGQFAAKLIEEAGCKGLSVGDAQISEKHAGFLVNRGRATARDALRLMREVERRVWEASGVRLEREVIVLGE